MSGYSGIASVKNLTAETRRGACNANGRCPVPTPQPTFAGLPTTQTFGTKNAPLDMSHEPAVKAPDLIAAVSSSNCR
jgi:hypothetical protein